MPAPETNSVARQANTQNETGIRSVIKSVIQGLLIMVCMQIIIGRLTGNNSKAVSPVNHSGDLANVPDDSEISSLIARPNILDGVPYSEIPHNISPIWPPNSLLDIIVLISSSSYLSEPIPEMSDERVILNEVAFKFGNFNDERIIDASFEVPSTVQNNGTLWGHFYIGLSGEALDPTLPNYNPDRSYYFRWPLTQYAALKREKKTKNLLAGPDKKYDQGDVENISQSTIISHYHPNFTLSFIPDTGILEFPKIHPAMRQYFQLKSGGVRDSSDRNGWYYPVLFINTFWQLKSQLIPLNSTTQRLPIYINLNNLANWKFGLISSIDEGAKQATRTAAQGNSIPGGGDGSELEMIKEILLDTNPFLLGTTIIVTILHMIFEMLAFKSDISHYRNKKNNIGISIRSILGNVFMQTVILLYLLDNNDSTSWMILFSQGMGILLELWKITTVSNVRIRSSSNIIGVKVVFEDKHVLSATEEKTKEYDAVAFKYLYIIAIPLLLGYAAYSVAYQSHKSWYSFIIATLVGSVYAYGFLMMVPSLYINYRLKSVAHMPAKAMTYKFLNTFIDDLFAFTVKMPTLHRLATLRDDVIFFVYLYQSWKYRTDYTRVNEFGQGGDETDVDISTDLSNEYSGKVHDVKNGNNSMTTCEHGKSTPDLLSTETRENKIKIS